MGLEEAYRFLEGIGGIGRGALDKLNDHGKSPTDVRLRFYGDQVATGINEYIQKYIKNVRFRTKGHSAVCIMWSVEKLFIILGAIGSTSRTHIDTLNTEKCVRIRTNTDPGPAISTTPTWSDGQELRA